MKDICKIIGWFFTNGNDEVTDVIIISIVIAIISDVLRTLNCHIDTMEMFMLWHKVNDIAFCISYVLVAFRITINAYRMTESSEEDGFLTEEG